MAHPDCPTHGTIDGPIVMIAFGSIGKGTLPLIERHFNYDPSRLIVIDPNDADRWLEESGLTLTTALADDVMIRGDAQRLRQLWSNLLDNSCAYTQPPGKLSVSLICERGDAVITWQDSAPGVPEEELSRLTERLYRVEGSRNRASGGSGLGLSIASALVTAHGGTLTPSASALGGLTWTLRLPLLTAS